MILYEVFLCNQLVFVVLIYWNCERVDVTPPVGWVANYFFSKKVLKCCRDKSSMFDFPLGFDNYWIKLGPFARTCNPSKWEADIWGWLEVRRSAMLHFNERQRPHWACRQYGHTGGTRGWLGVERWQLCLRDTSRSANCHRRAAVGHWISLYVKCCRMVDSVPIWHTISIL